MVHVRLFLFYFASSTNQGSEPVKNRKEPNYGENHHRAKLTDHEVEQMRQLHAEGHGYGKLAKMFDVSKSHARNLCLKRQRPA
jgi:hypothetical protein